MVSNKTLTVLTVIAVGLLAWAFVLSTADKVSVPTSSAPTYLVQGLDPSAIASIVVEADGSSVTLARSETGFVVKEKNNYPAATKEINTLISSCLDIKREEQVTDNAGNHLELEVAGEKPNKQVRFQNSEGKDITGILIGKTNVDAGGSYVRQSGSDVVYVSRNVPYLRTSATDYIDKKLVDVEREKIVKVIVMDGDDSYTLRKDENNVILDSVPAGKQAKTSDLDSVFYAIDSIDFSDVAREVDGLTLERSVICELNDSSVYTFKIGKKEDKTYVTGTAVFTDQSQITINPNQKDSEEELKKKETVLLARDAIKAFAGKHQGWIYELASWQADKLTKSRDDLLEDAPQVEEVAEEAENAAPATENAGTVN